MQFTRLGAPTYPQQTEECAAEIKQRNTIRKTWEVIIREPGEELNKGMWIVVRAASNAQAIADALSKWQMDIWRGYRGCEKIVVDCRRLPDLDGEPRVGQWWKTHNKDDAFFIQDIKPHGLDSGAMIVYGTKYNIDDKRLFGASMSDESVLTTMRRLSIEQVAARADDMRIAVLSMFGGGTSTVQYQQLEKQLRASTP